MLARASDDEHYDLLKYLRDQYNKELMASLSQWMVSFRSIMRNVIKNTKDTME